MKKYLLLIILFSGLHSLYAQTITKVYGEYCVNQETVFQQSGSCSGFSWGVSSGTNGVDYSIIGSTTQSSFRVKWLQPISNTSVYCVSSCNGSMASSYSSMFSIGTATTPSVSLSLNTTEVCEGGSNIVFTAAPTNGGSSPTYYWYVDGSQVASGSSASYTYTNSSFGVGAHSVYVILSSNASCLTTTNATSSTLSFTKTAKVTYTVTNYGPGQICSDNPNASFHATPESAVGNFSYQWYKNGSAVSGATSQNFSTAVSQNDNVYCQVSSDYWCVNSPQPSNTYTVNITSSTTPTVTIYVPPSNYCSGQSISFSASSPYINGSSTYSWKLNGVQFSTLSTASLTASTESAPGSFSQYDVVTVAVNGLSGTCLSTTSATGTKSGSSVTINPMLTPDVSLTISPANLCLPGTITLTANPTNGGSSPSYAFYIDGAQAAIGSSNTYSSSSLGAGSHSAYVVMTSNAQCLTTPTDTSPTQNFTVASKATYTVTNYGPGQICSDNPNASFYAQVTGAVGNISYQWYKNGSPVSGATSQNFSTAVSQDNTIYCQVSSDYWCVNSPVQSNTYTVNITSSTTPTVSIYVPPSNYCSGQSIPFSASSPYINGSSTYSWKLNGSQFSTASTTSLTASTSSAPGSFSQYDVVTVDVSGLSGTCLTTTSATGTKSGSSVTINPIPTVIIAANDSYCESQSTVLTATAGMDTYQWYLNNSAITNATSQTYSASQSGTYKVVVTKNGCQNTSADKGVSMIPKPQDGSLQVSPLNICLGESFTITSSGGIGTPYYWASSDGGVSWNIFSEAHGGEISFTHQPAAPGVYRYMLRNKNECGYCYGSCPASPYIDVIVTGPANPGAITGIQRIIPEKSYLYTLPNAANATGFVWAITNGEILSGQGTANVNAKFFPKGGNLSVTASNACGTGLNTILPVKEGLNYIVEETLLTQGILQPESVDGLNENAKSKTTSYLDGLGRPTQSISWRSGSDRNDIVQPVVYDEFGRETTKYLPYVSGNNGLFKENPVGTTSYTGSAQHSFYNNGSTDKITDDAKPYAQSVFEQSPLNRVLKQGSAGEAWQPIGTDPMSLNDKTIKKRYESNGANELYLFKYDLATGLVSVDSNPALKFYGANQLSVNKTIDEHNNEVIEYTDKEGRTICKKVQYGITGTPPAETKLYASTYYIYDDFGTLALVLPPEGVKEIMGIINQN